MRRKIAPDLTTLVGKTPMVFLRRFTPNAQIAAKLEFYNPTGSLKDRIAYNMIFDAEKRGFLSEGSTVIEPTSGNTGISLAFVCQLRGYRVILAMPDSMTVERRNILRALGAELLITPGESGMKGAIEKAEQLVEQTPASFMPQQFNNPSNPEAHEKTTAVEIWDETGGEIDVLVAGVGTGGTVSGIANYLRKKHKKVSIVAVEPAGSAVLSGGSPGKHQIQGIGAGFIPRVLNTDCLDEVIAVSDDDAFETTRELALKEGLLVGISSGAVAWAARRIATSNQFRGQFIVAVLPDGGQKYITMGLFQ